MGKTNSLSKLKTYSGSAGDYFVIANDGDNEFAVNFCVAQRAATIKGTEQPTLGVGIRLRYYANDGHSEKFQKGFPAGTHGGGSHNEGPRIKEYVPIVHASVGVLGLKIALEDVEGEAFIKALKAKIKACGGKVIVSDDDLAALLVQPLNGVPDETPDCFDISVLGTKGQQSGIPLDSKKVPPAPLGNSASF